MNNNLQISEWLIKDDYSQFALFTVALLKPNNILQNGIIQIFWGHERRRMTEIWCLRNILEAPFLLSSTHIHTLLYISIGSWRSDTRTIAMLMRQGVCAKEPLYNRIICVTNWVSVLEHTMRPIIIFSLVYVLIRIFKALLVNKNAKRFNKKAQMKSFSWIDPECFDQQRFSPFPAQLANCMSDNCGATSSSQTYRIVCSIPRLHF